MFSLQGLIVVLILIPIVYVVKQFVKSLLSPLRKIPGPVSWSPIGQLSTIIKESPCEPHIRWSKQYGGIFRYSFPIFEDRVTLMQPDHIKHVLVNNNRKYTKASLARRFLMDVIGNGLILLEGQNHATARKVINPAFKYSKIKAMVPIFQNFGQVLVNYWQNQIENNEGQKTILHVQKDLSRTTLDVICKCAFDYDCNALTDPNNPTSVAFDKVLSGLTLNWTLFIPGFKHLPTSGNLEAKRALSLCHGTVNKVICDKMDNNTLGEESCLLDILLSLKDEENNACFTKQELRDHVMTFMSAGHETTSVNLAWTLYVLANNPDIQYKARQEVRNVLQKCHNMTWDSLEELKYLDKVIKESLRLYSPIPITSREAIADDKIGGYDIPKGTIIIIVLPHRLPEYFPDPLRFDPDRWDTTAKETSPYIYLPFLTGSRTCIGSKFALTEAKCILSLLINNFSFSLLPNQQVKGKFRVTMRPDPPLQLMVSPIDNS